MTADDPSATDGRALIESILQDVSAGNTEAATSRMAPEIRLRMPFAPPGMPDLIEGREQVHRFLATVPRTFSPLTATVTSAQALTEPGGWVFEYEGDGVARATGRPYRNRYVGLFSLEGALLTQWTEYYNPSVLLFALGKD